MAIIFDTSYFKPTDYTPYFQALQAYNTQYEKEQAMYDAISEKLGTLSSAVEGTTRAKDIYDKYNQKFNSAVDAFGNGRNVNTAKQLSELRKMYGTEIKQLETARDKMKSIVDTRAKLAISGQGQDMINQDVGNLDTYLNNPNYTPQTINGTLIAKQASDMVSHISKQLRGAVSTGNIDQQTKGYLSKYGVTQKELDNVITSLREGSIENITDHPVFGKIFQNAAKTIYENTGVESWKDNNASRRVMKYIGMGFNAAVGEDKFTTAEDKAYAKALDWEYTQKQMALADYYDQQKQIRAAQQAAQQATDSININQEDFYDDIDEYQGDSKQKLQEYIDKGYFIKDKNGQYKMSKKGEQEYNSNKTAITATTNGTGVVLFNEGSEASEFRRFYDRYTSKSKQGANINKNPGQAFNELYRNVQSEAPVNVNKHTAYRIDYDPETSKSIAAKFNKMQEAVWDKQSKQWKTTGQKADLTKIPNDVRVSSLMSEFGTIYEYTDKDGEQHRLAMPSGSYLHRVAETNRDNFLKLEGDISRLGIAYANRIKNPNEYKKQISEINKRILIYNSNNPESQIPILNESNINDNVIRALASQIKGIQTNAHIMQNNIFAVTNVPEQKIELRNVNINQ